VTRFAEDEVRETVNFYNSIALHKEFVSSLLRLPQMACHHFSRLDQGRELRLQQTSIGRLHQQLRNNAMFKRRHRCSRLASAIRILAPARPLTGLQVRVKCLRLFICYFC
jgi:hypothetical protein